MRLDLSAEQWNAYRLFLNKREGFRPYFYPDRRHLVTIGVGCLVDAPHAPPAAYEQNFDRWWHTRPSSVVFRRVGALAACSRELVFADWVRVKSGGRHQLVITEEACRDLRDQQIRQYIGAMIAQRGEWTARLPPLVQQAIIDVRFNPADLNPFASGAPDQMWTHLLAAVERSATLPPRGSAAFSERRTVPCTLLLPSLDLPREPSVGESTSLVRTESMLRALRVFRDLWGSRADAHYQQRHRLRCTWFLDGIRRSMGAFERAGAVAQRIRVPDTDELLVAQK